MLPLTYTWDRGALWLTRMGTLSGAMIGALSGRLEGILDDDDLDDAVEYLLRMLGVPCEEALEIAHRPLPPLP